MTNNQFELLIMHGGMMQEGMSSDEAITAIRIMQHTPEDIEWLENRIQFKKKKGIRFIEDKRIIEWIEQQQDPSHNQW